MSNKAFNLLSGIVFCIGCIIGWKTRDEEVSEKKKELMESIEENKKLKKELEA